MKPQVYPTRGRAFALAVLALALLGWISPAGAQVTIQTVVPDSENTGLQDEDGDTPAYAVLSNGTTSTVEVSFYTLSDDEAAPTKWTIPSGTTIPGNGTLTVFCSGKNRTPTNNEGELHTNFTYPSSVPYLGLTDPQGTPVDTFSDGSGQQIECPLGLVFPGESTVQYLIPDAADESKFGSNWIQPGFYPDPADGWLAGTLGVGYDDPGLCGGMLLYHPMDDGTVSGYGTGDTVFDTSGPTVRDGTIGIPGVGGSVGRVGSSQVKQGLGFSGNPPDAVTVPHDAALNPGSGDYSVSVWFLVNDYDGTRRYIASKQEDQGSPGWAIFTEEGGVATIEVMGSTGSPIQIEVGNVEPGKWTQIGFTIDRTGGELRGYYNGIATNGASLTGIGPIGNAANLVYGRGPGGQGGFWQGALDEFAVWGVNLGDTGMEEVYSLGLEGGNLITEPCGSGGGELYTTLIQTDVETEMQGVNTSCYIRVPFYPVGNPALLNSLTLAVNYDDGFIAYLNGIEVARRNFSGGAAAWNSSGSPRTDTAALTAEVIDLTAYVGLLTSGENILAFHALNDDKDAERFVLSAQLCATEGTCEKDTLGTDFWICFPENYAEQPNAPTDLSVCITGDPGTTGTLEVPGIGYGPVAWTIGGDGKTGVVVDPGAELGGLDSIENKGVHIVSNGEEVGVWGFCDQPYSADTFHALPTDLLGIQYLVLGYPNVNSGHPATDGTQFAIVAPYDDTKVFITPSVDTGTRSAGGFYTITLNRGDTYQLRNGDDPAADLSGTRIASDKPVGVFGSNRVTQVNSPLFFFSDITVEQLLPVNAWGTTYCAAPLQNRSHYVLRIIASEDFTNVNIQWAGGGFSNKNLMMGEVWEVQATLAAAISAEQRILVGQYATSADQDGNDNADPFMIMLQPSGVGYQFEPSWMDSYRICAPPGDQFESNYANLIIASGTIGEFRVNGAAPTIASGPNPHPCFGYEWVTFKLGTAGVPPTGYLIENIKRTPFGLVAYGWGDYVAPSGLGQQGTGGFVSYGHPGAMRFGDLPPQVACPAEIYVNAEDGPNGSQVLVPDLLDPVNPLVTVVDDCTSYSQLIISQSPQAGASMPAYPGTRIPVTVTANDGQQTGSCVTTLVVLDWEEENFGLEILSQPELEATVWGPYANPDGDMLNNFGEEFFGTNPLVAEPNGPLAVTFEEDPAANPPGGPGPSEGLGVGRIMRVRFQARTYSSAELHLEGTQDLSRWNEGPAILSQTSSRLLDGGEFTEYVYDILPSTFFPLYYVRARVEEGP